MEGKLFIVLCFLATVLIVEVTGQNCPTYYFSRGACPKQRCITDADCSGLVCCRLNRCGRRCILPESGVVQTVENAGTSPNEASVIRRNEIHSGMCPRNIDCRGKILCSSDGECDETEKCCRGGCGRSVCAASLRSSIFSYFPGK